MNFGLKVCSALVPPTPGVTRDIWTALLESVDPVEGIVSFEGKEIMLLINIHEAETTAPHPPNGIERQCGQNLQSGWVSLILSSEEALNT